MGTTLETIRRLTIVAQSQGVDALVNEMRSLDQAQRAASASAAPLAKTTDESARRALSAAGAFDRLRRGIDEEYRASVLAEKGLRTINAALSQGAIDASQAAAAVDLLNRKYVPNVAPMEDTRKGAALARHEVTNLSAQISDIGISLAGGQSPFLVMAQQGSQVAGILGERGLRASIAAVGTGLLSLINPTTLFLAGITAVGYAGYYAFSRISDAVEPLEKTLERHERITRLIEKAYGDAGDAAGKFVEQSKAVTLAEAVRNAALLRAELDKVAAAGLQTDRGLFSQLAGRMSSGSFLTSAGSGGTFGGAVIGVASEFEAYRKPIEAFIDSVRRGQPDVKRLRDEVAAFSNAATDPAIVALGGRILDATEKAGEFANKVDIAEANVRQLQGTATEADRALLGMSDAVDRLKGALDALGRLGTLAMPDLSVPQQAAADYREAMKLARGPMGGVFQWLAEANRDAALQRYQDSFVPPPRRNPARDLTSDYGVPTSARGGVADSGRDRLQTLRQTIEAEQINLDLIGKGIEETERLRFVRQNLAEVEAEASRNGTAVTVAYRMAVEGAAEAIGKLRLAREERGLMADLAFERAQLGRSETEQRVAAQLRALYGEDYTSQMDGAVAGAIRYTETLGQVHDAMQGFVSDLRQGLASGADFWTAFGEAAGNTLDTLLDKLTTLATNQVFNALLGGNGGSGAGGGLLGSLLSVLGLRGGGTVPNISFAGPGVPSFTYASGGFTGAGGRDEPAGIVHRGEYVFDAASVSRIGVQALEALRSGSMPGYAEGGYAGIATLPPPYTDTIEEIWRKQAEEAAANMRPILRAQQAAVSAAPTADASPQVVVNVVNYSSENVTSRARKDSSGKTVVDMVVGEVSRRIARGQLDSALKGRFGVKPTKVPGA